MICCHLIDRKKTEDSSHEDMKELLLHPFLEVPCRSHQHPGQYHHEYRDESFKRGVSNELRKKGILVSPGRVRSIYDMETFQKRLKALSAKVEQEGIILDENQVVALEKAKTEK